MPSSETHKTAIANLRTEMLKLDPDTYQRIREDFYRIGDNLKPLADALEIADADLGGHAGPLLDEHYIFAQMYDLLRKSNLGGVV
ncbi:hypothetical protein [Crateriforma conspicua]|uniref:Uncharacterized protein n=1 Tax=Crateriforma conspicua TaxID=2527996 RepID=A0A5C5XRG1_9PLAN|nr:hypothetical protein [Crateriforma conspicua]TWT65480.1 hypothetical protein Pan14r_50250 [Crateriforma conspicua]